MYTHSKLSCRRKVCLVASPERVSTLGPPQMREEEIKPQGCKKGSWFSLFSKDWMLFSEELVVYRFSVNNINVESLTRGKPLNPYGLGSHLLFLSMHTVTSTSMYLCNLGNTHAECIDFHSPVHFEITYTRTHACVYSVYIYVCMCKLNTLEIAHINK